MSLLNCEHLSIGRIEIPSNTAEAFPSTLYFFHKKYIYIYYTNCTRPWICVCSYVSIWMDLSTDLFIVSNGCIITSDNVSLLDIEGYSLCKQVLINHVMKEALFL